METLKGRSVKKVKTRVRIRKQRSLSSKARRFIIKKLGGEKWARNLTIISVFLLIAVAVFAGIVVSSNIEESKTTIINAN